MPSPLSDRLHETATALVSSPRGILAADESIGTMSSRLEAAGVEATERNRRDYRELLISAPDLADTVSGVILCDETFRQDTADGTPFARACRGRGILPGIKVDTGTVRLPGAERATLTQGLEGLDSRLAEYADLGAVFAKWRAVVDITDAPAPALEANADALARYAALCQAHGIVPIVEPEVLCSGSHDIGACAETTGITLGLVFDHLRTQQVDLAGIVLKPNLVTSGLTHPDAPDRARVVAEATLAVLSEHVPADVPGIAFLSGGHPPTVACAHLRALNEIAGAAPWRLSYSFGRALVSDALTTWGGRADRVEAAQAALLANCRRASDATLARVAVF